MKKLISLMLCTGIVFCLTGCGNENSVDSSFGNKEETKYSIITCKEPDGDESLIFKYNETDSELVSVKLIEALALKEDFTDDELKSMEEDLEEYCADTDSEYFSECKFVEEGDYIYAEYTYTKQWIEEAKEEDSLNYSSAKKIKESVEDSYEDIFCEID